MDDLLDEITGLVGIFLLPEPDDSIDDVSNKSSEDEDSDKIIIVLCAIRTRSCSLITSIRTHSSSPPQTGIAEWHWLCFNLIFLMEMTQWTQYWILKRCFCIPFVLVYYRLMLHGTIFFYFVHVR